MPRGLLPFLVFAATYIAVRFGLSRLQEQVWGPVLPPAQDPWPYMFKMLVAGSVALGAMMLVVRGQRGGGMS